jgi:mycothiol synthase
MTDTLDKTARAADPAGTFVFRRPQIPADVPRIVQFINDVDAVDQNDEATDAESTLAEYTWPGFDPAQDAWVVEEPGNPDRLIGENWVVHVENTRRAFAGVRVHPAWRRRGVGSELLARAVARGREMDLAYLSLGIDDRHADAQTFVQQRGFRPVVRWVLMRAEADLALAAPVYPPGYQVRSYVEVNDPAVAAEALNRGFTGHWENRERPVAEIAHRLAYPHTRPEGIFLAFAPDGDVAGICWAAINETLNAQRGEALGHINSLGVAPEHRRRGLGRALLLEGMRWLRASGQGPIELDAIGNNELALPLYHDVGFAVKKQGQEFRLDL